MNDLTIWLMVGACMIGYVFGALIAYRPWLKKKIKDLEKHNETLQSNLTAEIMANDNDGGVLVKHPAYTLAREKYGLNFELGMVQEECAELIIAVSEFERTESAEALAHIFEEIGDVENMAQQMKHWFPDMVEECNKTRIRKLDRLKDRVENGYHKKY